jgi:hypothetical protein
VKSALSSRRALISPKTYVNAVVASWTKKPRVTLSASHSLMLEDNVGEDGLSSQSMYTVDIDEKNYINSGMFHNKVSVESDDLKLIYTKLMKVVNELIIQASTKTTLATICNSKSVNTHIAQVPARTVTIQMDDIEFYEWSINNIHAHLWSCHDIDQSPILRLAMEKSINKSPHHYLAKTLFHRHINIDEHQFIGFVSLHFKSDVLTSFHVHSFVTFYSDSEKKTVVTCMLTSRQHILLNMQDRLLQLVQLIQFGKNQSFLLALTKKIVGSEVILSHDSINRYKVMSLTQLTYSFNPVTGPEGRYVFFAK